MRIVSLLPSTTEMIYALGLGDDLVGVTHECDFPPQATRLPVVTRSVFDYAQVSAAEVDAAVAGQIESGASLYRLDTALLEQLRPDLIVTQELCAVCAVSFDEVRRAVQDLGGTPQVLSFEPSSLDGVLDSIEALGRATGRDGDAAALVALMRGRIAQVASKAQTAGWRPRVALLEWLDPPFGAGHWMPELVTLAGGSGGLGAAGMPSRRITWGDVIALAPEVIVVACCGMPLDQSLAEARVLLPNRAGWEALPAVRRGQVFVVDANAYFSRPGPRVVESLELLAELVHPALFGGWAPSQSFERF